MHSVVEASGKAKEVLRKCSTPHGLYASCGSNGYTMVFARDSMIGLIGASAVDREKEFKKQFSVTLNTLAKNQSIAGQIPNAVDLWDKKRPKQVTFATLDSTLWYLLGLNAFSKSYRDRSIIKSHQNSIDKAFFWLKCQDTGEDSLPEQLPTSDWQDCFPHKYGHTINTIALYYAALKAFGKKKEAKRVSRTALGASCDIDLFCHKMGYFFPWRWKNHEHVLEAEYWFDSLGNMLAICSGLANRKQTESILGFVESKGIDKPFPIRAIFPPIKKGDREWHDYFGECIAGKPNWYINGGIWPFIGGFYVAALVKARRFEEAEQQLAQLTKANMLGKKRGWEFNEWIHPTKRKPMGSAFHSWSAGSYLFALRSVLDKKVPFFG